MGATARFASKCEIAHIPGANCHISPYNVVTAVALGSVCQTDDPIAKTT
jgi:hypothetical protein